MRIRYPRPVSQPRRIPRRQNNTEPPLCLLDHLPRRRQRDDRRIPLQHCGRLATRRLRIEG
ncbi:MAG: hypothetical protein WC205_13885 [Opitutaceae bacterium]